MAASCQPSWHAVWLLDVQFLSVTQALKDLRECTGTAFKHLALYWNSLS